MKIILKYKILLNNIVLLSVENSNKKIYYLDNGKILYSKDIKNIEIVCSECNKSIIWKTIPNNEYLIKNTYLCRSCKQHGELNSQFGKRWTSEMKYARSRKYTGCGNPMYGKTIYDIWSQKYDDAKVNELKILHAKKSSLTGEKNGMFGLSFYDKWVDKYGLDMAYIKLENFKKCKREWAKNNIDHYIKNGLISSCLPFKKTSIEKKVELYLINLNIDFKYNFIINKYQFDFLIKDMSLIIEVHGDYWHANPNIYSDILTPLNETQKFKVYRDIEKLNFINSTSYKILYLWETDIENGNYIKILKENGIY